MATAEETYADEISEIANGSSGSGDDSSGKASGGMNFGSVAVKALAVLGGVYAVRKLTKRTTRWDHAKNVANNLSGEKFTTDQAAKDPIAYFNLRLDSCPAATLSDNSRILYYEQAFWRTPERPFRQRFYMVKPCGKDMKCDVEVASYAVKDVEQYRNFCERSTGERPQPSEVPADMGEHLTTVFLSKCERGKKCAYEGSTPPGGYPNNWNGATRCVSEMTLFKNGEVHVWDRAYDDNENQVWGPKAGPYEFKPRNVMASSSSGPSAPKKK